MVNDPRTPDPLTRVRRERRADLCLGVFVLASLAGVWQFGAAGAVAAGLVLVGCATAVLPGGRG
jgi:hypothetical protein